MMPSGDRAEVDRVAGERHGGGLRDLLGDQLGEIHPRHVPGERNPGVDLEIRRELPGGDDVELLDARERVREVRLDVGADVEGGGEVERARGDRRVRRVADGIARVERRGPGRVEEARTREVEELDRGTARGADAAEGVHRHCIGARRDRSGARELGDREGGLERRLRHRVGERGGGRLNDDRRALLRRERRDLADEAPGVLRPPLVAHEDVADGVVQHVRVGGGGEREVARLDVNVSRGLRVHEGRVRRERHSPLRGRLLASTRRATRGDGTRDRDRHQLRATITHSHRSNSSRPSKDAVVRSGASAHAPACTARETLLGFRSVKLVARRSREATSSPG